MQNKYIKTILFSLIIFHSCNVDSQPSKIIKSSENKIVIPLGAIPTIRENGRIILPVVLNDSVFTRLILDNGTTNLALDNAFTLKNNSHLMISYDSMVYMEISMPDGKINARVGEGNPKIKIGSSTIKSSNFICLYDMSGFFKNNVTGFFPMHWLGKNHLIYIDPRNNYITQPDSIDYKNFLKIPFTYDNSGAFCFRSTFKFNCKGTWYKLEGNFVLDFGNPRDEIWIDKKKIAGFGLDLEEGYEITQKDKKPFQIQNAYADTACIVAFGKSYFKHLRISVEEEITSPYEQFVGVIGERLLENYIVAIDYKNKLLYLKSINHESVVTENKLYTNWGMVIRPKPTTDITDTTHCKWIVAYLKENKKAIVSGIELWDEVQEIDNIPISEFSLSEGLKALETPKRLSFIGKNGVMKILED